MMNTGETKPLLIIDGYGFIFRAYHVQPPLSSPSGIPVGAIYGFTSMLIKLINDFKPEHAVIVLDHGGKNFRHDLYKDYKANRPPLPDDLVAQLKLVKTAAQALNFTCLSKQGFEADDIIATLADRATVLKKSAMLISSDKDLMQLVNEHVGMYDPAKSKYITDEDIFAKFGVGALKVREVQALMGDSSDNIPGVAGIGPKTAALLINQFGDLENVLASIDQVKNVRLQELLKTYREDALISWKLVGLNHNVDIDQDIENFHWNPPETEKISNFLNEHGFKSLNKRIENLFSVKIQEALENAPTHKQSKGSVVEVTKADQLKLLINEVKISGQLAVNIQYTQNSTSIVLSAGSDLYLVPYKEQSSEVSDLFSYTSSKSASINFNRQLHDLFEDSSIKKITYNMKELLRLCCCNLKSFDDLQIMDYILNAGKKPKDLAGLVQHYNGHQQNDNDRSAIELTAYFLDCYRQLTYELFNNKALHLYEDIDLPLCYILHKMEQEGVKIDTNHLVKLSVEFARKITNLEKKIFAITGEEFNIASPKQLGEILFGKMQLPFAKTTGKTKSYSTSANVLEQLQEEGYEIADLLLEYRHFTKLKNTYTDTLPKQVDPRTNRIHTTFLQAATSTGRLSSTNPNVQNIPTRIEEGNSIRAAFIASPGTKLISADYSQIELRILSHVANISSLKQAFDEDQDIHAQTASQIFNIPLDQITPEVRRRAKAINFGIIYGISAFGLAKQLNIPRKEASDYIEKYFKEYPGIQKYMSETIEFAKENDFVPNLIGRKCFLPTINDKNHALRSFGERAAINAPMQSLASDIVKMAMITLDKELTTRAMQTKMILQIHDELIFEAPETEVEKAAKLIKSVMENSFTLDVKTKVEVHAGNNWQEIH